MKRKTAKEILAESFGELAENKAIDRITIRDITDNCGYSPATFYRQFKDKYDLIAWDYTRTLDRIMSGIDGSYGAWKNALSCAAEYYSDQRVYLKNLLLNTVGLDAFIRYMREIHYDRLRACILNVSKDDSLDVKTQMYIRMYILGSVQLTCEWILGDYDAAPEELAEVYEESLPEPLKQFLCR